MWPMFGLRGSQCGSPDIVILDIDEKHRSVWQVSLAPSRHAELVFCASTSWCAQEIAFSFAFTGETPDDETFAQACRNAGNVYLPV